MQQSSKWPDRALVGYVMAYSYTPPPSNVTDGMISDAIKNHYNVFVYAFGAIDSSNNVTLPDGISEADLSTQIQNIHANNGLALLSFGGQNNTFSPGSNVTQAADNTAALIQKYGFDGVDLDLESITVDSAYLESYINELRNKDSSILLTAAPQIAGGYGGPAALAPTNIFTTDFLIKAKFDAILVQEYNQFGGAVFDGKQDTDVGFITASFDPLAKIIPSATKIVVGEPANSTAGSGLSNPADVVQDINSGDVKQSKQYGGVMTWAINYDADQGWSFANGVFPVV